MIEAYFPILFGILFIMVILGFVMHILICKELKNRFPAKYIELGSPSLIMNNTPSNNFKIMKFIFKRNYMELKDVKMHKYGNIIFVHSIVYILYFLCLVALILELIINK